MKQKKELIQESGKYLERLLWTIFSRFIRLRDSLLTTGKRNQCKCITCGRVYKSFKYDLQYEIWIEAWHCRDRKVLILKFNKKNVNGQCSLCNHNWWEVEAYKKALDCKYGTGTALELDTIAKEYTQCVGKSNWFKLYKQDLIDMIMGFDNDIQKMTDLWKQSKPIEFLDFF